MNAEDNTSRTRALLVSDQVSHAAFGSGRPPSIESVHRPGNATARAVPATSARFLATHTRWGYRAARRCLDVLVSASALVAFAPLLALIALAIRLESRGGALFRHQRVGVNRRRLHFPRRSRVERRRVQARAAPAARHEGVERRTKSERRRRSGDHRRVDRFGRSFLLYKFRTMYNDARDRFPELYAYEYSDEELYTLPIKVLVGSVRGAQCSELEQQLGSDPRLTRVGRWLRRTSLDELPNFINVLRGDMTLIGPRPDIAENIRYYRPEHMTKLDVKPGITGLAQIKGRGTLSLHHTNEYDVEYIRRRSLWLDLKILLDTIRVTLKRDGAY